ncbi:MAG: hypothetical protein WAQ57_00660 [Candidatus Saccharimonadales bacterium]
MNEQFPAPNPDEMLIKGQVLENGRHLYQEENGQFMSRERVAEIGAAASVQGNSIRKPWNEMTTEEQLARAHVQGYTDAVADTERDTLVLGKHESESEEAEPVLQGPEDLVDDWARAEYNNDTKAVKEAEDAIQDYIIRAQASSVMNENEVSGFIDTLHSLKEVNKQTRAELVALLNEKLGIGKQEQPITEAPVGFAAPTGKLAAPFGQTPATTGLPDARTVRLAAQSSRTAPSAQSLRLAAPRVTAHSLDRPVTLQPSSVERDADGNIIGHVAADGMWAAPHAEDAVQLDSDYFADQLEQPAARTSRWNRMKAAVLTKTPVQLVSEFNVRRQERGERPRSHRALYALGGVAAAGAGIFFLKDTPVAEQAWDNINNLWEGPRGNNAHNLAPGTGSGTGYNYETAADILTGDANLGGTSGTASGGINYEAAANILGGDANLDAAAQAAAEMPVPTGNSTFTVMETWKPGNPTAWSWAESQGIPSHNIDNFLSEVMGAGWQEQARGMNIGDSISATAEQIARYKSA